MTVRTFNQTFEMSAELKQEGPGISALGPASAHDIPYIGDISDGGNVDEKSDKDRSPFDSETAIDQLDKEGHVGDDFVIRTGADASQHLLSLRDDEDPVLTFRSAILGTAFACFQAAMNQIYNVSTVPFNTKIYRPAVQTNQCVRIRSIHGAIHLLLWKSLVHPITPR